MKLPLIYRLVIGFSALWTVGMAATWREWVLFSVAVVAWFALNQVRTRPDTAVRR